MSANEYTYGDIVMANDGYSNLGDAEVEQVNSDFGFDVEFDVRENANFTLAVMGWNMEGRPSEPDKEGSKALTVERLKQSMQEYLYKRKQLLGRD